MTLEQAKQLSKGDKLMTPHSPSPYEALNVTDVKVSETGNVVFVRLACIAASSQMAGGWFDATAFIRAPRDMKWNRALVRYEKLQKNRDGSVDVVAVTTREDCRTLWRADRARCESAAT